MPKAPSKAISSTPFPFVRQFTAPPFFVDIDDAKRKSQLLLDAVQHAGPVERQSPKKVATKKKSAAAPAKKRGIKKVKAGQKK